MAKLDGGPASIVVSPADGAFQASYDAPNGAGLSLRDYFAAQALPQAIQYERDIRRASAASYESRLKAIAQAAYAIADAMLSEREE